MKEKQKAVELIEKYLDADYLDASIHGAKSCALICVQECIDCSRGRFGDELSMQYWLNVEQEIIKL